MRSYPYPAIKKENEARADVERAQALAMTMAVFTQVHAARARYAQQSLILKDAADYLAVQRKILAQARASASEERDLRTGADPRRDEHACCIGEA